MKQRVSPPHNSELANWREASVILDVFKSDETIITQFIESCSADDLHMFTKVHGIEVEVQMFATILSHPSLDRATALEIYHHCNPAFYESKLAGGIPEDALAADREDAIFIEIMDMAHRRLMHGASMSSKFVAPSLREWDQFPAVSPRFFKRWPLMRTALAPTSGNEARPSICYDYSKVRLTYDTWHRLN